MFNQQLKQIRQKHKLSQKSVAEALGIDRTTYTYYETGRSTPSYKNMCKLCKIFNVTPNYFFANDNDGELMLADASSSDNLSYSEFNRHNEQLLLMNFRLLDDESKQKVLNYVESLSDDGL